MKNTKVQKMVAVALFAAMGVILQYVAFPLLPAFSFMKVDFSDIPVMLSMFLFGPMAGIATAFIRSLLHLLTTGLELSNLIGDAASFFASVLFTLPMYYFFNGNKNGNKKIARKVLGVTSGVLAMTIFMSIANYFVITPVYLNVLGLTADKMLGMSLAQYVAIGVVPFNLLKGAIVSAAFLVIYTKLLPFLEQKRRKQQHIG
ncbi:MULTISPECIES: ECF transporter S component [Enterococcus]|uniref:ECF transporter S component n=1 Tax=Enterococcus TaxID=1350 RepID=UPI001E2C8C47|nr:MULTISPECIES: ECF transporter S component [Enterococcus]MCD1023543.1 ECF transporter S component [Enterococcus sp. SMC-9]MDT2738625.1 ECF transporter S component [Enterococcus canintestini]